MWEPNPAADGSWRVVASRVVNGIGSPRQAWKEQEFRPEISAEISAESGAKSTLKNNHTWVALPDGDGGYDPRTRPFWHIATTQQRGWTAPYRFWNSNAPGVTNAAAIPAADGTLAYVTAIDIDLTALGTLLDKLVPIPGALSFAYTADGVLVALPIQHLTDGALARNELPTFAALNQPVLTAFRAKLPKEIPLAELDNRMRRFQVGDDHWLALITPLPIPDGQTWYVGMCIPRATLLAEAEKHAHRAWIFGAAGTLVAGLFAGLLALKLATAHRAEALAKAQAKQARADLREMGSYRLRTRLGRGGMGEVWIADHRWLIRPAALKLIRADRVTTVKEITEAQERFLGEARTTADLRSRHTVRLYDFGIAEDGAFYYAMELLVGLDLEQLVRTHGPLPIGWAIRLVRHACFSLAEAHRHGLVHRDIKPANLFCCNDPDEPDICKVLDFGLVKTIGHLDGSMQGTLQWMAPEQIKSTTIDGRADIYALGGVLYFLLTGQPPFPILDAHELIQAQLTDRPPTPSSWAKHQLPPAMDALILRCLAKDPAERPASAEEFGALLEGLEVPLDQAWNHAYSSAWWAALPPPETVAAPRQTAPPPPVFTAFVSSHAETIISQARVRP